VVILIFGVALAACRREPAKPPVRVVVPVAVTVPAPAAITLTAATGKVTHQGSDGSSALVENGAGSVDRPLALNDVVTIGDEGAAVLRLPDGRALALSSGSRVRIKTSAEGTLAVEIEAGTLVARVPATLEAAAAPIELDILTPLGVVHVPRSESESAISVGAEAVSVAVAVGEIDFVARDGKTGHAAADQTLEVSLGGIQVIATKTASGEVTSGEGTEPPAVSPAALAKDPRLLAPGQVVELDPRLRGATRRGAEVSLPPARGLRIYADALAQVMLTWPAELTDAVVEVAYDARFSKLALLARPTSAGLRVPAPRRGQQLYWRISGASGDGGARRTLLGQARFFPDRAKTLLDLDHPRNLVADTGGQVTTVYFQSVLPALTFSYAARPGAAAYRVRVFRAGDLKQPIHDAEVDRTTCALPAGTLGEGSYLWHAVALDGKGHELPGGGGLMNKLELVYDNPLNTLAIGSPKPGETVSGREVDVTGAAPVGSRLYVNGRAVPLDPKGRFELRIERSPSVVFRLVANDGSESYWVRQLKGRS
jgi:hypothetical protein